MANRRLTVAAAAGLFAASTAAADSATAAPPDVEHEAFSEESMVDEAMSASCGFEVLVSIRGVFTGVHFAAEDVHVLDSVFANNTRVTWAAGDESITLRYVVSSQIRVAPDGDEILSLAGHNFVGEAPTDDVGYTGVLKVNLTEGTVLHEPQHLTGDFVEGSAPP